MVVFLNILYAAFLFCIFLLLVSLPVAFVAWGVRRWHANHRLARLPWRRRRALMGLALLWSAAFSRLSRWNMFMGIGASLSVLLVVFLVLLRAMVCSWTMEDSIILDLQMARDHWLQDDCPRPADPLKYLPQSSSFSGSVYTNLLVAKDTALEKRSLGMFTDRACRGLFAIREHSSQKTYVIATTGEILLLNNRGEAQFLKPH